MAFTRDFLAFLTSTAIIMVFHCEADPYPPPTGLSHTWLDMFTVEVSWDKPSGLPDDSKFVFLVENTDRTPQCVDGTTFKEKFFTKNMNSDYWTYNISTVMGCDGSSKGTPATITIQPPKPKAELVEDFRCIIQSKAVDCTWKPLDPSQNLNLSYRTSGRSEKEIKSLKQCAQFYGSGERKGCYLPIDTEPDNIWILIETPTAMSTFELVSLVVVQPKLSVEEEADYLRVSWTHEEAKTNCWIAEICHKQCDKDMGCRNTSTSERMMTVPYKKGCLYEFRSRIVTTKFCPLVTSKQSEVITYGANNPDRTLTVIAIVVPVVLSICVILSCYCFRRHSAIICPTVPDPSAIFKEMMMNGNKDGKTTAGNLYKPVPESIESCKITLVTDNSDLQQNS